MFLKFRIFQFNFAGLTFFLVAMASTACGDAQISLPDSLHVESVSPENGSTQVAVNSELILSFSDELDLDTLDPGAISLQDEQGLVVSAEKLFSSNNQKLQLIPAQVLQHQSTYYFLVKQGLAGLHQVGSLADFHSRFTTQ